MQIKTKRLIFWTLVAGVLASFDQFHLASGLMNHQDNWVDKVFPWWLSPNYMIGGLLFYLLFEYLFPAAVKPKHMFCLHIVDSIIVATQHCLVYAISFFLCNYKIIYVDHNEVPYPNLPFVIFHLYAGTLFYQTLKSNRLYWQLKSQILLYCTLCAALGLSFEWISSFLPFGFKHQPCFESPAHWTCANTSVALLWLYWVYFHQALIVFKFSMEINE